MKTNRGKVSALLKAALVVVVLSVTACDTGTGGGGGGQSVTYTGAKSGVTYTLKITEKTAQYAAQTGDAYELTGGSKKSAGTVSNAAVSVLTLKPANSSDTFTANISGTSLTALNGPITWTDGNTETAPGSMTGSGSSGGGGTTATPPPPPGIWTIVYDANGGDGSMLDSTAQANKLIDLRLNTFTRTYCDFAGWAKSKTGTMVYVDEQTGVPGQAAGTTLTLYALWTVKSGDEGTVVTAATNQSGDTITLPDVVWSDGLKTALESALSGGGITLDLSGVSGLTEWADNTLSSNKDKITSLVLPDTVTSLTYQSSTGAFRNYSSLTSVSGAGVTDIGRDAFATCFFLTTVNLPAAKTIGNYAFSDCVALTDLYLPTSGSSWPPTLEGGVFMNTGSSGTLSIHVGSANGNVDAYTGKWGTDRSTTIEAKTAAGMNAYAYGSGHKEIHIVN